MSGPYRKPGQPRGMLVHDCTRSYFQKDEWEALAERAGGADRIGEWLRNRGLEVLRGETSAEMRELILERNDLRTRIDDVGKRLDALIRRMR